MKAHLPVLAFVLLLAAVPAFADDLLDAVLWDGPSAFPSQSEHSIPPPSDPSTSHPDGPASQQPSPAPPPAPAAPAEPTPAELRMQRQLEEMRELAGRMESALAQAKSNSAEAESPVPAPEPPDWCSRIRLSLHAETDGSDGIAAAGELAFPLGSFPFDLAVRGFYLRVEDDTWEDTEYDFSEYSDKQENMGGEIWAIWVPLRQSAFSPHAGVGLRYEETEGNRTWYYYRRIYDWRTDHVQEDTDDSGTFPAFRAGAVVTCWRLVLSGEFIVSSLSWEAVGELSLRLADHLALSGLVELFDNDYVEKTFVYGAGIAILF